MEIREYTQYREEEILRLYSEAGWTAYTEDPEKLRKGFESSLIVLAAYEGDSLSGLIRAVGDGSTIIYIQDLLVRPCMQNKGVGTALLKALLDRYPQVRQKVLVTDSGSNAEKLYRSLGLSELSEKGCTGFIKID
ncbi:MAG: GNAT family N-acetyltransferase [Oscillospiraceae bacterium]|nr:GNAT family N-acetyltransferase [Oscillospiraceae bacterium]